MVRNSFEYTSAQPGSSLHQRNQHSNLESQKSLKFEVQIEDTSKLRSAAVLVRKHRALSGNFNIRHRNKMRHAAAGYLPIRIDNEESSHHLAIGKKQIENMNTKGHMFAIHSR